MNATNLKIHYVCIRKILMHYVYCTMYGLYSSDYFRKQSMNALISENEKYTTVG